MKRRHNTFAIILWLSLLSVGSASADSIPMPGDKAPDFAIELLNGEKFELSATLAHTQKVYLFFFSPWCESYVKESFPEMALECKQAREHLLNLYASLHPSARFIGIGSRFSAAVSSVESYRDKFSIPFPLAFDAPNEVFNAYQVRHFPTLILVGPEQLIQLRAKGSELTDPLRGSK